MKNKHQKGFTLIEILIAMSIVLIIFSAVYGAYFAATSSANRCNANITTVREARSLLAKMTRQVRCVYVPAQLPKQTSTAPSAIGLITAEDEQVVFRADTKDKNGIILRMVTTAGIFHDRLSQHGPFQVAYRYDSDQGILFYTQQLIAMQSENHPQRHEWFPLAENVESIELSFFDSRKWFDNWNRREQNQQLPCAVKIEVLMNSTNAGICKMTTTASPVCINK
ncbi:MAG: prepilin-type N-terminal cleavage/methylation domain-containing protein [Sedimentisphaerales bacterium]|nr:prepilin-type N-terminal cleavage/methylation domain-containing protein [Sedimentisphaerales bacterium]